LTVSDPASPPEPRPRDAHEDTPQELREELPEELPEELAAEQVSGAQLSGDRDADEAAAPQDGPELSEFADPEAEVEQEVRRHPSTVGGVVYLVVLAATLAGIGISMTGRWRSGILWIGTSFLGAAAVRLVLPEDQAGMLHVRRRLVDVVLFAGLGVGLLLAAASVPLR